MATAGEIISYDEMCRREGKRLQKGMSYPRNQRNAVFLMSRRPNAPYADVVEEDGRVLIYQGHDVRPEEGVEPKQVDQPLENPDGTPTDNGRFFAAAQRAKEGKAPLRVHVYEKLQSSIWTFNGAFDLLDAWVERPGNRNVCKFRLRIIDEARETTPGVMENPRVIPGEVITAVWKRDAGKCVLCGSSQNLHFDHVIPYSKGETSLRVDNVQILCAKHNLSKGARI